MNYRILSAISAIFIIAMFLPSVLAVTPYINHQGRLTDTNGNAINADTNLEFVIYDANSGGSAVFYETHTNVSVTRGLVNLVLGDKNSLLGLNYTDKNFFLSVNVNQNGAMTPRLKIASVTTALNSTAGGVADGNCDNNSNCTITGKINTALDTNFTGTDNNATKAFQAGEYYGSVKNTTGYLWASLVGIPYYRDDNSMVNKLVAGSNITLSCTGSDSNGVCTINSTASGGSTNDTNTFTNYMQNKDNNSWNIDLNAGTHDVYGVTGIYKNAVQIYNGNWNSGILTTLTTNASGQLESDRDIRTATTAVDAYGDAFTLNWIDTTTNARWILRNNDGNKTTFSASDLNANDINAVRSIGTPNIFISQKINDYNVNDINRTVLNRCSGDINSVWTSDNKCVNISDFYLSGGVDAGEADTNSGGNVRVNLGFAMSDVNYSTTMTPITVGPSTASRICSVYDRQLTYFEGRCITLAGAATAIRFSWMAINNA